MRALLLTFLVACAGVSSDPARTKIASAPSGVPFALAQDATQLYFVDLEGSAQQLLSVPKAGGPLEVVADGNPIGVIAADDTGVYWVDTDGYHSHFWFRPVGGTPTVIATDVGTATGEPSVAGLDADGFYYADNAGMVWKLARSTGSATLLGTTDLGPAAVALDGGNVWVATKHGAKLLPATELSLTLVPPLNIAAAGGSVFVVVNDASTAMGSVVRGSLGAPAQTVSGALTEPGAATVSGDTLYVATQFGVHAIAESGDDDELFADHTPANAIITDDRNVYWADSNGAVFAAPLPK